MVPGLVKLHCGSVAQIWESISGREIGVFGMPYAGDFWLLGYMRLHGPTILFYNGI